MKDLTLEKRVVRLEAYVEHIAKALRIPLPDLSTIELDCEIQQNTNNGGLEEVVTELMHEFVIPAHLKGYNFIRSAIMIVVEDPMAIKLITKWLYPEVAKKNNTTPSCVERDIRHAIESAWVRTPSRKKEEVFGNISSDLYFKPSNAEFIAKLADIIRLQMK